MRRYKQYRFGVYVITDGNTSGLLLKRKKNKEVYPKYAYFWLKHPQGLIPTKEIKQSCDANCYVIEHYKEYQGQKHKYAKYRDQERIFNELKNYAEAVVTNPDMMNKPRKLTQDYSYATKGYPEVLSRFFERENSQLRAFLISSKVFKESVLKKQYGNDKVEGMAEEFGARDPHNVFPEENLRYLRSIEKVLEIGISQDPEWFRKRGPVAVDFDKERIYRRKKTLKQLNNLIMDNSVSLLEGISGTGKTVLALNLAYDLYKNGESSVYFFDYAKERDFDLSQLVHAIESVKGTFIIENIHLEPRKAQQVYSRFKYDPEKHILFTARPSYKEFQDTFSEDLGKITKLHLEPFNETENIINCFCSHRTIPKVVTKKHTQLLEMPKLNYWFLAFALKGCAKSPEKSELKSWIADEVKEYLRNLETCNDPYCDQYPGILLALSPLYKNEVPTAEHYLIDKLSFTKPALNDLMKRGEITRQEDTHANILYGLPHSCLADAYWHHGRKYVAKTKLRMYEEFLYDYLTSAMPNGLQAAVRTKAKTRYKLLNRLYPDGKIQTVIENEISMSRIHLWMMLDYCQYPMDTSLTKILANKITTHDDLYHSAFCLNLPGIPFSDHGLKLWELVDTKKLADRISSADDFYGVSNFIGCLRNASKNNASELCDLLNLSQLAANLVTASRPEYACEVIELIFSINENLGMELWGLVNRTTLGINLAAGNINQVCFGLGKLFQGCDEAGWELWKLLDHKKLATQLNSVECLYSLTTCIKNFFQVHDDVDIEWGGLLFWREVAGQWTQWEKAGRELYKMLDLQKIVNMVRESGDPEDVVIFLAFVCATDDDVGWELIDLLGTCEILDALQRVNTDPFMYHYIRVICLTEPEELEWEFANLVNKKELADQLSRTLSFVYSDICINHLSEMSLDVGEQVCELLDTNLIAKNMEDQKDDLIVKSCIKTIQTANPNVGRKLRKLLRGK